MCGSRDSINGHLDGHSWKRGNERMIVLQEGVGVLQWSTPTSLLAYSLHGAEGFLRS